MASTTKIAWATASFSPWLGCTKTKDPGCRNCYAAAMDGRLGVTWGPNGTRRRTADSTWKQVERWNRHAAGERAHWESLQKKVSYQPEPMRPRVFPSLCDPFEDWHGRILNSRGEALFSGSNVVNLTRTECAAAKGYAADVRPTTMDDVRREFTALRCRTPNLDWLLLTKRPENIRRMMPEPEVNTWLIYSASDQATYDAGLPHLMECHDLAPVWGLSLEPLLGRINLRLSDLGPWRPRWFVVGGESGPHFRPIKQHYIVDVARQCEQAGIPVYAKQFCGPKPGQQGRIPDEIWSMKQFPKGAT